MPLLPCVLVMTPQLFPLVIPLLELLAALGEILHVQLLSSTACKVTLRKSLPVIFFFLQLSVARGYFTCVTRSMQVILTTESEHSMVCTPPSPLPYPYSPPLHRGIESFPNKTKQPPPHQKGWGGGGGDSKT